MAACAKWNLEEEGVLEICGLDIKREGLELPKA